MNETERIASERTQMNGKYASSTLQARDSQTADWLADFLKKEGIEKLADEMPDVDQKSKKSK